MFPKDWTPPCGNFCTKKYSNFVQIPWRIFCKKGCDSDGETWEECKDECNEICYKDPVLKDHEWSYYIDRSPGHDNYSMECFRACISGCGFKKNKYASLLTIIHEIMKSSFEPWRKFNVLQEMVNQIQPNRPPKPQTEVKPKPIPQHSEPTTASDELPCSSA